MRCVNIKNVTNTHELLNMNIGLEVIIIQFSHIIMWMENFERY
jgi:hypothetical protein